MQIMADSHRQRLGPKQRDKHNSYDENVDEPAKLIYHETVEIEREVPAEVNEPVEGIEEENTSKPPAFEEN